MDLGCLPPKGIRSTFRKRVKASRCGTRAGEGREVELPLGRTLLVHPPRLTFIGRV